MGFNPVSAISNITSRHRLIIVYEAGFDAKNPASFQNLSDFLGKKLIAFWYRKAKNYHLVFIQIMTHPYQRCHFLRPKYPRQSVWIIF
tara:strand:- start:305 stop:568 length:264 start_codon:yes stop_codon:yes gene_type:complete